MTQLYFTDIEMPGAELGGENPLPDFGRLAHIAQEAGADASLSEEERRYVGYGRIKHILPYRLQDGYDRVKILRSQSSSSRSAVQQAIIDCSDYIKMVQTPRKIKVFRGFLIPKRADIV